MKNKSCFEFAFGTGENVESLVEGLDLIRYYGCDVSRVA